MQNELKIFSGNANIKLAENVGKILGIEMGKAYVGRFADGEIEVKIEENVRGTDCFIIQPTSPPVNENLMELLVMIDAIKRASAKRITAVIPYYGYGRQDRKLDPRVPISAKLVANLITATGVDRVLSIDLHAGQIQGFFDIPLDHLYPTNVFCDYLKNEKIDEMVVVAPDAGGVERARVFAKKLNTDLAIIDKRRPKPNQSEVLNVIGDVAEKNAIIIDDLVDTGGTLCNVASALKNAGANSVIACCSHGVLSKDAVTKIENSILEKLIITDSIYQNKTSPKIKILTISKLIAEAIKRIHNDESVSAIFM